MSIFKNSSLQEQIDELRKKIKCLECCEGDLGITELSPPVDTPGAGDPTLLFNPDTGELFFFDGDSWEVFVEGIVGITALSPPVDAPIGNDPTVLLNVTTGELFFWNGVDWVILVTAVENAAQIQTIEVDLSSADIQGMFVTPVIAVPGEVGKIMQVINCVSVFTYGGVQYTGGGQVRIFEETTLINQVATLTATQVNAAASTIQSGTGVGSGKSIGKGLVCSNSTAAFATGNGTIKHIITYQTITP